MQLAHLSIRQKLIFISMVTTFFALFLSSMVVLTSEYLTFRQSLANNLAVQAQIIGANSTAALGFDNANDAKATLSALHSAPNIVHAIVFDAQGKVFARYKRGNVQLDYTPQYMLQQGYQFSDNGLEVFEPIVLDKEKIGTLYLQSDLNEMATRLYWYASGTLGVMLLSLLLAYLLLAKLQRAITTPLLNLSALMQNISSHKNFALRSEVKSNDEIGELARGFNDMLSQIQLRDDELEQYRKNLEDLVAARTAELEQTNTQLHDELRERKIAEEGLLNTTAKLEKSNKELQEFAYIASHDLQEPLRKVQSFGDRLKQKYGDVLTGQGKEYLERMQNAAGRMQVLIQSLLEYSRVTSKAAEFETVNLNTVLHDVLSDLEVRIEQVQGQVNVCELPTIVGDAIQMRQLFQNLIGNALKFHRDNEKPVISISHQIVSNSCAETEQCHEIRVADNGIGFEQKYVDRIFGIFQRLHGRTEYEGTGIGLSVCRKIVERHRGTLTAESAPNEGATFIITLPIAG